ncbi:hypothetical protein A5875_003461, partial [Enterococcus sp. 3H8_DIV0648]
ELNGEISYYRASILPSKEGEYYA